MSNTHMITVSTIDDITEFSALREEWDELLHDSLTNCVFLSWEWLYFWWSNMSAGRSLFIIVVKRNDRLIAIAPLTIIEPQLRRLLPIRVVEFLGSGSVGSDYLDIIVRSGCEGEALTPLAQEITNHRFVLELAYVDSKSVFFERFIEKLYQLDWRIKRTLISRSPYADVSKISWESYLGSLSAKHRAVYLKKHRKLNRDFDVRLVMAVTQKDRKRYLKILVNLHLKRWNERGGSNAFNKPELLAFHEQISSVAMSQGWLRLYVLWLNDEAAAAVYGFEYGDTFYYYQAGYDPRYRNYSVGAMCIGMTMKIAIERDIKIYDFLHGDEEYKYGWAKQSREMLRLDLFPPTILGTAYQECLSFRKALKATFSLRMAKKPQH